VTGLGWPDASTVDLSVVALSAARPDGGSGESNGRVGVGNGWPGPLDAGPDVVVAQVFADLRRIGGDGLEMTTEPAPAAESPEQPVWGHTAMREEPLSVGDTQPWDSDRYGAWDWVAGDEADDTRAGRP
jgi:hypothetical protein